MKTAIEMARDAGAGIGTSGRWLMTHTELERLVALARADEREACAKVCDAFQARDVGMQPAECAGAIRSRSNT